eukprot:COSAG03_NODE_7852_length_865_cov_7.238903_1_plen_216_part_00
MTGILTAARCTRAAATSPPKLPCRLAHRGQMLHLAAAPLGRHHWGLVPPAQPCWGPLARAATVARGGDLNSEFSFLTSHDRFSPRQRLPAWLSRCNQAPLMSTEGRTRQVQRVPPVGPVWRVVATVARGRFKFLIQNSPPRTTVSAHPSASQHGCAGVAEPHDPSQKGTATSCSACLRWASVEGVSTVAWGRFKSECHVSSKTVRRAQPDQQHAS